MKEITDKELKGLLEKELHQKITFLGKGDSFKFSCDMCGKCCTGDTLNRILLRSYDMYNLEKGLRKTALQIINEHCNVYIGDKSGIPVIQLKGEDSGNGIFRTTVCPFLIDNKCSVHEFKPNVCKIFPLGRVGSTNGTKYFLQTVTCGNRNSTSIDTWIPDRDEIDEVFNLETNLMLALGKKLDLSKLNDYCENTPFARIIKTFYDILIQLLYEFDWSVDFKIQYSFKSQQVLEAADTVVCIIEAFCKQTDKITEWDEFVGEVVKSNDYIDYKAKRGQDFESVIATIAGKM